MVHIKPAQAVGIQKVLQLPNKTAASTSFVPVKQPTKPPPCTFRMNAAIPVGVNIIIKTTYIIHFFFAYQWSQNSQTYTPRTWFSVNPGTKVERKTVTLPQTMNKSSPVGVAQLSTNKQITVKRVANVLHTPPEAPANSVQSLTLKDQSFSTDDQITELRRTNPDVVENRFQKTAQFS